MSNYPRSQDGYLQTGQANSYRVRGEGNNWWVEGTDNNNVWVDAEPGTRYETAHAAEEAAEELAAQKADDLASAAADVRARR